MYAVPHEASPREPWLIATNEELEREERERAKFAKEWLEEYPFPGQAADKVPWLAALQTKYEAQQEEDWYQTSAPTACDLVKETLLDRAPNTLWLQLKVRRGQLVNLKDWTPDEDDTFCLPKHPGVDSYHGEETWPAYCQYLVDQSEEDEVVLAYVECAKEDALSDAMQNFLDSTGLSDLQASMMISGESVMEASYEWNVQKLAGENIYHVEENVDGGRIVVPLNLGLFKSSPARLANRDFYESLSCLRELSRINGNAKTYMLVQRETEASSDDESEEEEDGPDELRVNTHYPLWLPYEFKTLNDRIFDHFVYGKGESASIKMRLDKGNTCLLVVQDTGNVKVQMFEQVLDHIQHSLPSIQAEFCAALALFNTALYDNYWMYDNEYHEELPELVEDFATFFRGLLEMSDRELGLGLEENPSAGHGLNEELSDPRRMLYSYLESRSKEWENYNGKMPFHWKPGAPRKGEAKNSNA